jgi:hypothetical protein
MISATETGQDSDRPERTDNTMTVPMKRKCVQAGLPLLLLFFLGGPVRGEEAAQTNLTSPAARVSAGDARTGLRFHFSGFLSESYDNNILNYSDHDRALFDSTVVPAGRFGINHLDDYVTEIGGRLTAESGKRHNALRLRLKFDGTLFSNNSFRHYAQWGLEVRKNIKRSYLELSFSWLPKFNLRNLYWRPMASRPFGVRYAPADFGRLSYELEFGTAVTSRLDLRLVGGLGLSNYNYPFDERDNSTVTEQVKGSYDLSRRATLSASLGLAQSRAAGRDSTNAIVKDVSYNAWLAGLSARFKCDRKGKTIASTSFNYQHQSYLSNKALDVSHFERIDHDYEFTLSLSSRLTSYFQPELSYGYRSTSSNVVTSAADFGSYTAYRFGLQVTAYF